MLSTPLHTVVVVDDERDIRDLLTLIIRGFFPNQEVYACATQAEALAYLAEHHVACVITDYYLVESDGSTLAKAIHAARPEVPIILMTGQDLLVRELGAIPYAALLTKPIEIDDLLNVLEAYLPHPQTGLPR